MTTNIEDVSRWTKYNLSDIDSAIEEGKRKWKKATTDFDKIAKNYEDGKMYVVSNVISVCFASIKAKEFKCSIFSDREKAGNITKNAAGEFKFNAVTTATVKELLGSLDKIQEYWIDYKEDSEKFYSAKRLEEYTRDTLNWHLEARIKLEEERVEHLGRKISACSEDTSSIIVGVISDVYIANHSNVYVKISTEDNDYYCHIDELKQTKRRKNARKKF